MKKYDVVCAGIAVVNFPVRPVDEGIFGRDITQVEPMDLLPGGDAVNQAIVTSRLGCRTALLVKRGKDGFGDILLDLIRGYGRDIDLSHIAVGEGYATGVCAMLIRGDGQRHFCAHRGAVNSMKAEDLDLSVLEETTVASIGGLMGLPSFDGKGSQQYFQKAKECGAITVADTKADLMGIGLKGILGTLAYTDYFFPSYDEASAVSGETEPEKMADIFLNAGAKHVGIKLGNRGCYAKDADGEFYLPVYPNPVVDTTGAGDNFISGLIAALVRGWNFKDACRLASACGAICVSKVGPNTAVESFEQVTAFLHQKERGQRK